jgi:hypothetical protein
MVVVGWVVVAAGVGVAVVLFVVSQTMAVTWVAIFLVIGAATQAGFGLWGLTVFSGFRRQRKQHEGVVAPVLLSRLAKDVLRPWGQGVPPPTSAFLLGDQGGLRLVTGRGLALASWDWEAVVSAEFSIFRDSARSSNGILLVTRRPEGSEARLPLVVIGSGLGGMYPRSRGGVASLIKDLFDVRRSRT